MPLYDVRCPDGHTHEIVAAWDDRTVPCPTCQQPTERLWTAPAVRGDALDYVDENLGPEPIHITSRTQRARLMRERGLVEQVRHIGYDGSDKSRHTSRWV